MIPHQFNLKNFLFLSIVILSTSLFAQDEEQKTTTLEEVVMLGTRSTPRANTLSPVPVDIIDIKRLSGDAPQVSLNGMLNYLAPSFTSTPQTIADGTDHIDPANLRGFGPDQTLVLLNGKRRHTSALINVNGSMGRGSVGTDLNAIPSIAIQKIEVLRDGSAAQYGSDAMAGVMNLGLRNHDKGTQIRLTTGANISTYYTYTEVGKGNYGSGVNPKFFSRDAFDGGTIQLGINQGLKLGKKGFLNLSGTFDLRGYTSRSGERTGSINNASRTGIATDNDYLKSVGRTRDDYRMRVGQSAVIGGQLFLNGGIKLGQSAKHELYFFGGGNYRNGNSTGFYRMPFDNRNILGVYKNGFLPEIISDILDLSIAAGLKGSLGKWNYDISNTYGSNSFYFKVNNSLNASTKNPNNYINGKVDGLDSTKSSFDAGALVFMQNTFNADISRMFDILDGLNLGFGGEARYENYQQIAGETASWANYNARNSAKPLPTDPVDVNGTVYVNSYRDDGTTGVPLAGASVFPGFRPNAALSKDRSSFAFYADVEQNFTKWFLLSAAARFENYSDFGSNFSWKVATRISPIKWLNIRGSASTGFRAPSLHQRYLFKTSAITVAGVPTEQGNLPNDSKAAELLGIPKLKAETSLGFSTGFTVDLKDFKITFDAYQTEVTDRIILTDAFSGIKSIDALLLQASAGSAIFFANAVDTRNRGLDLVLTYGKNYGQGKNIKIDLSGTLSETELVGRIKASKQLDSQLHRYMSPINKALLTDAFPRAKANLVINWGFHKNWNVFARGSFIGSVNHVEGTYTAGTNTTGRTGAYYFRQEISPIFVTDISVSYAFWQSKFRVTLGVNNLFDVYPDNISASRGKFFKLETDATKATYNTIIDDNVSAKDLGINNDDGLTTNNQLSYSRRTSQIGLNGRFVFLRFELTL